MIKHIVMWTLLDSAEGRQKAANAAMIKAQLAALPSQIPQIQSLEVGINAKQDAANYDLVLIATFNSWQDLEIYQNHPVHKEFSKFVTKLRKDRAVVDYEMDGKR